MDNINSLWWQGRNIEVICSILNHINSSNEERSFIEKCADIFYALNNTWSEYYKFRDNSNELSQQELESRREGKPRSDNQSFIQLIQKGIRDEYKLSLCNSNELQHVINLEPQIMNHNKLLEENYDPSNIPSQLLKKSKEEHKSLVNTYNQFVNNKQDKLQMDSLLKKLATLLYIVRSNIMHGEKTKQGPDLKKVDRDKHVCETIYPLIHLILDYIFDKPSTRLAVYGTLAPGESNNYLLEEVNGKWETGEVIGTICENNGLRAFKWDKTSNSVHVKLFTSNNLPVIIGKLDRFEGFSYKRILIPIASLFELLRQIKNEILRNN